MPELTGRMVSLRLLTVDDAPALCELRCANRAFFERFEPARDDVWYTVGGQRAELERAEQQRERGRQHPFGIFDANAPSRLAGVVTVSCIERGAWQNCNIGYSVCRTMNGRGLATEAVGLALGFAFGELALHRVQAAVMPGNAGSVRVLEKNGFRREGTALRYLRLNGEWRDHDIFAITAEEHQPMAVATRGQHR